MSQWSASLVWLEFLQQSDGENDDQLKEYLTQPEFADENWALWRNEVLEDLELRLRDGGCTAILAWVAWGGVEMKDALEPRWVSPDDLVGAVAELRALMRNPADTALVLRDYEDYGSRGKPKEELFAEDLAVIEAKALWAKRLGKSLVSFDVNHSGSN
jgi:hypothetical protein